jgi:hypothetical protein
MKIVNSASVARDYAMLERNILAHVKLALLLSLSSTALVLHIQLPAQIAETPDVTKLQNTSFPLSIVLFIAGVITVFIGCGDYISNYIDMMSDNAFLVASK